MGITSDIDTDIDTGRDIEIVEERTLDFLINAGSVTEIHAIKNEGKYELVAITSNQIRCQLYTQTGKRRRFSDLDKLIAWCERREINHVQVFTEHDEVEPEPA